MSDPVYQPSTGSVQSLVEVGAEISTGPADLPHRGGPAWRANSAARPTGTGAANPSEAARHVLAEMAEHGLVVPGELRDDGQLHRVPTKDDKRGERSGWYIMHNDGNAVCVYGDWRTGLRRTWTATRRADWTPQMRAVYDTRRKLAESQRRAEMAGRHTRAAQQAATEWAAAREAPATHPYLVAKSVRSYGLRQDGRGRLLVPVRDVGSADLVGLQYITPSGEKWFVEGTAKKGHGCVLGDPTRIVLLAEGYATGATCHEATGWCTVVAFDAGNLVHVARRVRARWPAAAIVIAGDDDRWKPGTGNVGREKAEEAARAVGGRVALPDVAGLEGATDWNDLALARGTAEVRAALELVAGPADERPVVELRAGQLTEVVAAAEQALYALDRQDDFESYYAHAGTLVRVTQLDTPRLPRGVTVGERTPVIRAVDADLLVGRLARAATWLRYDGRAGRLVPSDPALTVARQILAKTATELPVRPLVAVIGTPTLRPDGTVLDRPGYDTSTHLLYNPGAVVFPGIAEAPSLDDALEALHLLDRPLESFPFVAAEHRAAALAAILTAIVRRSLPAAPMFAITAPTMGTGKSLLADVIATIATGEPAAALSQAEDPAEEKKRLLALLLAGASVAVIDNIERPLASDALCTILTQEVYADRVLGSSEMRTVPTSTTWLATGNNLVVAGDLSARTILVRLDARCERPEERSFALDILEWVRLHRPALVAAALTVLRAHEVAGRPKPPTAWRFGEWNRRVRAALLWVGAPDPLATRQELEHADPERQQLRGLLTAWHDLFGTDRVTCAHVLEQALHAQHGQMTVGAEDGGAPSVAAQHRQQLAALAAAIDALPSGLRQASARSLGKWLSRYHGRIEGGLQLTSYPGRGGTLTWSVAPSTPHA